MRIPPPSGRRRARIEIIPLIDVVFFLLATFVMVSLSMVKNQGIAVRLPAAVTGTPQDRKQSVTVTVRDDGALYLDQDPVSLDMLRQRLRARQAADPDLRVFLHGDEAATFGRAVEVLDEIRQLGITRVAIQTQSAPPRQTPTP